MQRLHVDRRLGALSWRRKRLGRSLQQLRLPLRDLIGVNVVALRELGRQRGARNAPVDRHRPGRGDAAGQSNDMPGRTATGTT